jgi:hypothetical protein
VGLAEIHREGHGEEDGDLNVKIPTLCCIQAHAEQCSTQKLEHQPPYPLPKVKLAVTHWYL